MPAIIDQIGRFNEPGRALHVRGVHGAHCDDVTVFLLAGSGSSGMRGVNDPVLDFKFFEEL